MLKKYFLQRSSYTKNILTLIVGTGLAQVIPIAASPILTRLYSPSAFGTYAAYLAIVSILSILATGRYELAILLPKKDRDAMRVVTLSIGINFIVCSLLTLVVAVFNKTLTNLFKIPALSLWLYWIPTSVFLAGAYQSLNYWSNRKAKYKRLAFSRTFQSASSTITQLSTGYINTGTAGLIGGQLIGQTIASAALIHQIMKEDKNCIKKSSIKHLLVLAKKYINFPKYMVAGHSLNAASSQMPIMLLNTFFSSTTAGLYSLAERLMGIPISLIAGAIGDVFRQEASNTYIHSGDCRKIFKATLKKLMLIAIVPSILFYFLAPFIFEFAFGTQWREAGIYAQILTPVFFLRFATSPLSIMFMIAETQKIDLAWQVLLVILATTSFLIGKHFSSVTMALTLYSFSYSVMYLINVLIAYKLTVRSK